MELVIEAHEIPPDLLEFFEPVDPDAPTDALDWKPQPLSDAHYAAFPAWLPTWCIRAGTSESVCSACLAPYAPVIERGEAENTRPNSRIPGTPFPSEVGRGRDDGGTACTLHHVLRREVLRWLPTCPCAAPPDAATVLDPFSGAGTTCMAADRLGRHGIGVELSEQYQAIAEKRLSKDAGMFLELEQQ